MDELLIATQLSEQALCQAVALVQVQSRRKIFLKLSPEAVQSWDQLAVSVTVRGQQFKPKHPTQVTVYIHGADPDWDHDVLSEILENYGHLASPVEFIKCSGRWAQVKTGSRKVLMERLYSFEGVPRQIVIDNKIVRFYHYGQKNQLDLKTNWKYQ